MHTQTRVHGHKYRLARAHTGRARYSPKALISERPAPWRPLLPAPRNPRAPSDRVPRLRASRTHSLGAGAGAPGPRARILQAAPESGRAAAWRLPAPGKSPAGPSEDVGGRQLSGQRRCPTGVLLGRRVWESQENFDARRPERTRPPPPLPLRTQKSDAGNKSQASKRTVPRRPSI